MENLNQHNSMKFMRFVEDVIIQNDFCKKFPDYYPKPKNLYNYLDTEIGLNSRDVKDHFVRFLFEEYDVNWIDARLNQKEIKNEGKRVNKCAAIIATAIWRKQKIVYRINKNLFPVILETSLNKIQNKEEYFSEIIRKLKFRSFYIEGQGQYADQLLTVFDSNMILAITLHGESFRAQFLVHNHCEDYFMKILTYIAYYRDKELNRPIEPNEKISSGPIICRVGNKIDIHKCPHIRAGHVHNFPLGPKGNPTGYRTRFISPIFVNMDKEALNLRIIRLKENPTAKVITRIAA